MNTRAPESPESGRSSAGREGSLPEGVFACELEADRLVVSYVNPALPELLGCEPERAAAGDGLFDLLAGWLDAATRSEIDRAVESGRQVWVRLERPDDAGPALKLMIKPASVPGAWVGSVRSAEAEDPSLTIRRAVLAEHSPLGPDGEPGGDAKAERILDAGSGAREAALARALDAAGITWLEQEIDTGALTLAGRRPSDLAPGTPAQGAGLERLVYPADQERRRVAFEAVAAGRAEELYCAYRIRDAAGTWQWMLETGRLVTDAAGAPRYVATLQAVPDRESTDIPPDPYALPSEHASVVVERFKLPGAFVELYRAPDGGIEFTFLSGRLEGLDLREAERAPESLLGRIETDDRVELESRCALAAAEESAWDCGFEYTDGEGERRCAHLHAEPVPIDGDGALFRGVILEATERRRIERALGESEERFRQLYEYAPFMMHSVDASGAIVSANAQWLEKLGYERAEAMGRPAERIFAASSKHLADVGMLAAEEGDGFRERECLLVASDGRELEGIVSARIERDDSGALVGAHFLLIDVTDRNRAMQGLRESEARFRAVVEDQTDAVCRFDPQGRILFANDACLRAASTGAEAPSAASWFDLVDEFQAHAVRGELGRLTPKQPLLQRELRMPALGGRLFQWTIRAFFDAAGEVTEYQAVGRDMEELQQLEAEIREVSQRERRRIGHDLHDGLGQELTGLSLMLRKLELDAAAEAPSLAVRMASVRRMVNQSLASARSLARGLSPLDLERGGLAGALEQLAANAGEMYDVCIGAECEPDAAVGDGDVAGELYRIAQEATNNAVKHGDPTYVAIRLRREGPRIVLEIEDDGTGLPDGAESGTGLGLKIMRYRANIIGASMEFASKPGRGTLVRCQLHRPV